MLSHAHERQCDAEYGWPLRPFLKRWNAKGNERGRWGIPQSGRTAHTKVGLVPACLIARKEEAHSGVASRQHSIIKFYAAARDAMPLLEHWKTNWSVSMATNMGFSTMALSMAAAFASKKPPSDV